MNPADALTDRAADLVRTLGLAPHPEGGYYREVFRAASDVLPDDGRGPRAALTTIYFLLTEGAHSALHRVTSDEVWHHYEGAPLDLTCVDAGFARVETRRLGPLDEGTAPMHVVPAGAWQAARTCGAYTLVGCTVGPGFAFEDFALLRDDEAGTAAALHQHPALQALM